jgi:hypothetical protein
LEKDKAIEADIGLQRSLSRNRIENALKNSRIEGVFNSSSLGINENIGYDIKT